jgi:hypothetical protein
MSRKGTCSLCHQYRWLNSYSGPCKPCSYPLGKCLACSELRKIYVQGHCYLCYQDQRVKEKLKSIESNFLPLNEYNRQLFDLYLTYVRRYRLQYIHVKQAQALVNLLQTEKISALLTWAQVHHWYQKYPLPNSKSKNNGSAFYKIGYMLQELGILPPKEDERHLQFNNLLNVFNDKELKWIQSFLRDLKKTKPSQSTQFDYLRILKYFKIRLEKYHPDVSLLQANQRQIELYIDELFAQGVHLSYVRKTRAYLNKVFKWCQLARLIHTNPCKNIIVRREPPQVTVCSEEQIKKLFAFVKNPSSSPEQAFLLSLILFFGLNTENLTHAKLSFQNDSLTLLLRRKALTKGKRYYNREESLHLPTKPPWFLKLQKRFYKKWLEHYEKIKKSYPNYQLTLPYHNHYNRTLHKHTVLKRVKKATLEATGVVIPPRVLKQTCAHIYSRNQDASLLSRLGWSPQFAFCYTWLPRRYFTVIPKQKTQV